MTKLLGIEEAAALLNKPVNTLRFWRAQGLGPPSAKLGRSVVYRREDLERWIDEQFKAAAKEAG